MHTPSRTWFFLTGQFSAVTQRQAGLQKQTYWNYSVSTFYRPEALPVTQPTASKHLKDNTTLHYFKFLLNRLIFMDEFQNGCWQPSWIWSTQK